MISIHTEGTIFFCCFHLLLLLFWLGLIWFGIRNNVAMNIFLPIVAYLHMYTLRIYS